MNPKKINPNAEKAVFISMFTPQKKQIKVYN